MAAGAGGEAGVRGGAVQVTEAATLKERNAMLAEYSLEDTKAYLQWEVLRRTSPYLTPALAEVQAPLDRALTARPGWAAALELRARLRADAGDAAGAVDDHEAALGEDGAPAPRLANHLAAAALCQDRLDDLARARPHLEAALAISLLMVVVALIVLFLVRLYGTHRLL